MTFKITYNVHGMIFEATAYGVTDAFDYLKAIIKAEKTMYPKQQETMDEYFKILGDLARGNITTFSSGCGVFKIETVKED